MPTNKASQGRLYSHSPLGGAALIFEAEERQKNCQFSLLLPLP